MASNLADKFEEMADAVPDRLLLVGGGERVTFGELEARANRLAHHLADHRVRPGASVGLVARNSVAFVVSFLACFKLRAKAELARPPLGPEGAHREAGVITAGWARRDVSARGGGAR